LPPTEKEVADFVADKSPNAYEKVVDRLLASPAYGERWTGMWLDLARYADTKGYERDPGRNIWRYRDWLIKAFNADKPFDQFTVEQLAGDLLPNPTDDQLVATGFHRNTMTNDEGGTQDEEFRVAAVIDRVNTTWDVLAGNDVWLCAVPHAPVRSVCQRRILQVHGVLQQRPRRGRDDRNTNFAVLQKRRFAESSGIE
jgi:hypothetical protein